jgi:ribosomal 50S subunit-recycling heat shock protein
MRMPQSQRVVIDIPVRVRVNRADATPVEEITKTVIVNANGALIKLSTLVVAGETLQMVNLRTNAEVKCTVANTRIDPKDNERAEAVITFDEPTPGYWGLSFPPSGLELNCAQ